ncbi:hypothetical protein [Enterobacter cancerogenus]|nr:hypothetical protein [Salmonella enterica]ECH4042280.1 hypothetical protein [Salmonella enterica]
MSVLTVRTTPEQDAIIAEVGKRIGKKQATKILLEAVEMYIKHEHEISELINTLNYAEHQRDLYMKTIRSYQEAHAGMMVITPD